MEGMHKPESAPNAVSLRKAKEEDLDLLFNISTVAMKPVSERSGSPDTKTQEEKFAEYKEKFVPEKIEVIQYEGKDVGRLRVVRTEESIYVGGIQILPEYQGRGIGTSLFTELIKESKDTDVPIILEVHDVNTRAISFYENLGFEAGEKVGDQTVMKYSPIK